MRFLTSALIAEGASDDRFLPFLLRRTIEEICAWEFTDDVDVDHVTILRGGARPSTVPEIVALVRQHPAMFHLFFVHRDQDGNTERVWREWFDPIRSAWRADWAEQLIPVIPVRKTEAWVLADGDALRDVLGVRWTNTELGVPGRPSDVERISEPKEPIRRLVRRLHRPIEDFYEELAESISLDVLAAVPSFLAFRERTIKALADIGFRPRSG